jgi:histone acetyltransferase (RNA polymerase elongator complex component)
MCDTFKQDIDLEDLIAKADGMLIKKFKTPSENDINKCKLLLSEILKSNYKIYNDNEINTLKRKYKIEGKKSIIYEIYMILIERGELNNDQEDYIRKTFMTKSIKSNSGIVSITIFTSPYPEYTNEDGYSVKQNFTCSYNCHYCPSEPNMPRSYLTLEPATLRAKRNDFDCVQQIHDRMNTLYIIGHNNFQKIELNILGGTFNSYPKEYRDEFCRDAFYAVNTYWSKSNRERLSLDQEKKINETGVARIIGVTIESHPATINPTELKLYRKWGITRVQLGIQHLDDDILKKLNRNCTTAIAEKAIKLLKETGFKVQAHYMPNLPFSSPEKDRHMLIDQLIGLNSSIKKETKLSFWSYIMGKEPEYWEDYELACPNIQCDQLKIYPCAVTVYTEIEKWFKAGSYIPYDEKELIDILIDFKSKKDTILSTMRLDRIVRDFFADNIYSISGSNLGMRDQLKNIMEKKNLSCSCIRCREPKDKSWDGTFITVIRHFYVSGGHEYFISAESNDNKIIYGFCRLRLDKLSNKIFRELNGDGIICASLIRELHVYSNVTKLGHKGNVQHRGLGTILMKKAEEIAKNKGYNKMAVIAGIGARTFYKKIGYHLDSGEGEYMMKDL